MPRVLFLSFFILILYSCEKESDPVTQVGPSGCTGITGFTGPLKFYQRCRNVLVSEDFSSSSGWNLSLEDTSHWTNIQGQGYGSVRSRYQIVGGKLFLVGGAKDSIYSTLDFFGSTAKAVKTYPNVLNPQDTLGIEIDFERAYFNGWSYSDFKVPGSSDLQIIFNGIELGYDHLSKDHFDVFGKLESTVHFLLTEDSIIDIHVENDTSNIYYVQYGRPESRWSVRKTTKSNEVQISTTYVFTSLAYGESNVETVINSFEIYELN